MESLQMTEDKFITDLRDVITNGDEEQAASAAQAAIDAGVDPTTLIKEAINGPMDEVGKSFQNGDIFLPELIMIGDTARIASDVIVPHISIEDQDAASGGKVVLGTIQGDMHDIGKNIVSAYLMATGFQVKDLGTNVTPKDFVRAVADEKADVIAISTLLSTTQPLFANITKTLVDSGQRDKVFVIVGGGPVTPEWAADIGADGYGRDAADAADLARQVLTSGEKPPFDKPLVVGALKQ
jgi:methylmalonyl-CoA mutase cobalamin-binding domain/chain